MHWRRVSALNVRAKTSFFSRRFINPLLASVSFLAKGGMTMMEGAEMLSKIQRLAAIALARLAAADRERALRRGHLMVNIDRTAESGVWTPVNLDPEIVKAAEEFAASESGVFAPEASGQKFNSVFG